jgi:2,5-furandicarboxylate decarboxylase 1
MNIVKQKVPDIRAAYAPPSGWGVYGAVIQLDKSKEGVQNEAIEETFNKIPSLMWVVAVDTDVDIYDPADVAWAITTRCNAKRGLILLKNAKGFYAHPVARLEGNSVTKVGIDATAPYPRTREFERVRFKDVNLKNYVIKE